MAASRLSESQKQELVERYRQGESTAELAAHYGCSPNTVSRTVKAALEPAEYERLKQQQRLRPGQGEPMAVPAADAAVDPQPVQGLAEAGEELPEILDFGLSLTSAQPSADGEEQQATGALAESEDGMLPIDDADDFGNDDDDEADSDSDFGVDDGTFIPIPVLPLVVSQDPVKVHPLEASELPESLYMLVDKTVELQPRPLREFTELGLIPADEEARQALQLFANPRQAKRHCGRTQRVIKMPDPAVLLRQASYLQIKGISRLVVEGTLYALPGL